MADIKKEDIPSLRGKKLIFAGVLVILFCLVSFFVFDYLQDNVDDTPSPHSDYRPGVTDKPADYSIYILFSEIGMVIGGILVSFGVGRILL